MADRDQARTLIRMQHHQACKIVRRKVVRRATSPGAQRRQACSVSPYSFSSAR